MPSRIERIEGALVGLLVGDALGVPYEFRRAEDLPPLDAIEFDPPEGFRRTHHTAPRYAWSDDGAQALCVLTSYLDRGFVDLDDLGARFVRWWRDGYLAVDGVVFDIGIQTSQALGDIAAGVDVRHAGPDDEMKNGNGALMRVLPLVLVHRGSDEELVRDARLSAIPTHPHVRSQLACALLCLYGRAILEERTSPYADAVTRMRGLLASEPAALREFERHVDPERPPGGNGSGYVVDCLHSARFALASGDYERALKVAVSLGNDTDTTACVAGGLAGLRDGIDAIPERWRTKLAGREILDPILTRLRAREA